MRVIDADGSQLGVLGLSDALRRAQAQACDLVEIAPNAQPPVCRIIDFGKYRYEQSRKDREARKHQHATKVKELKFHANISEHDYGVKLRHIRDFMEENIRVKVSLVFRGREMAHQELGRAVIKRLVGDTADIGHPEAEPKMIGRAIHVMLTPKPTGKKQKPADNAESAPRAAESADTASTPSASGTSGGFVNAPKVVVSNRPQS